MGNPHTGHAQANLDASTQMPTLEHQSTAVAVAAVQAQMAIAYELNTIGRILAYNGDIVGKVDTAADEPASLQHNTIIERLGL